MTSARRCLLGLLELLPPGLPPPARCWARPRRHLGPGGSGLQARVNSRSRQSRALAAFGCCGAEAKRTQF